jgi:hypothetical protein
MEGGGFFSSIGKAFKNVYSALKKSGVIDKAKDAALKKGRELGGEAISAAAKRVESEAGKRGYDISGLTQKGVERAHSALIPHNRIDVPFPVRKPPSSLYTHILLSPL